MAELNSPSARAYMDTPHPDAATPWREATYTVIDLELTGLDPAVNEIISFATVPVSQARIRLRDVRYRLVRPRRMPGGETIRIHGLRETDLAGAPPLSEVLDQLLEAITGTVLVAHIAAIEESFLRVALRDHGLELRNPFIDTATIAVELRRQGRLKPPGRGSPRGAPSTDSSPGLTNLARTLGMPVHRPHHADGDALTAAQVFLALATQLEALEPVTVGSLERLYRPAAGDSLRRQLRNIVRGPRS